MVNHGFRAAFVVALTVIMLPATGSAEVVCALGTGASAYKASSDERPSADTMQIIRRVNDVFVPFCRPKCPQAAMLRNPTAANLMLTVDQEGGKLVYSPPFFASVYGKYGEAGIMALVAHVYAHAIDEVTRPTWIPPSWNPELRADAWAGCVLAKSNLPPNGLTEALAALAMYPPPSQTAWSQRIPGVRLGFTHCGGDAARFDSSRGGTKGK